MTRPRKPAPLRLFGRNILRCDVNIDGKRTVYPESILWTTSIKTINTATIRAWCDRADAWLADGKRRSR